MQYLTEEDVKWKGEKYYAALKSKWNGDKYGEHWQNKYAPKPSIGAMVWLCDHWKPSSYEEFFNMYINDNSETDDIIHKGRTLDDLEKIAISWQKDVEDYETPLSEYFDAIILHAIVETYAGVDFEKKAIKTLQEYGYDVVHGDDKEDSEMGIDLKVYKDNNLICLLQIKPLSFIYGNRKHTKNDRKNAFSKHEKGNKEYPGIKYLYLLYDAVTMKWVVNVDEKRCAFKFEDLVNNDAEATPKKKKRELTKNEVDELFNNL